jgi:membrane associated rhomboid family serine protease
VTLQGFLELFGANVLNPAFYGTTTPAEVAFGWLHLAGALVAAIGFVVGLVRIFRAGDLIAPVFAVAIGANVGAYMISTHAQDLLGAREMAAILPLGAVLAGRVLGDRLAAWIRPARRALVRYWLTPVLAVLTVGYLAALGFGAAQPARPGPNEPLAAWLTAHGLTGGLATYWQANSTNVDSHGRLVLSAVVQDPRDRLVPYLWETNEANYDPARRYANFVVADGPAALPGMKLSAELTFGKPAQIYQADGYTILVWNKNLLAELSGPGLT